MTDSGVTAHFPRESHIPSMFSDIFAQIESELNPGHSKTGIHDAGAHIAAISTVDQGIDTARQFVRSLLTRRNTLVPISRLPPEILAQVFHHVVLKDPPFSRARDLGWIKVTHVCQHWRQVALNDSSLWARISGIPNSTEWISEMLTRTEDAPLDIEFSAAAKSSLGALLMISPHLPHTRRLSFNNLSTLHSDSIQEIFSREAPALEHLELTVTPYSNMIFPDFGSNILFKGHAPRLRVFSLSGVVIPWSLVPGQLTQLKMGRLLNIYSPGNLNQLIDLLVNCPALENLVLFYCLPPQLIESLHDRTIHLPHLSYLRLYDSTSHIMNMLKILKLPSSTRFHLDCTSNTTSIRNDSEGSLLRLISAHFRSPAPIEFKSLTATTQPHAADSVPLIITASTFPYTSTFEAKQLGSDVVVGDCELLLSFSGLSKPGLPTDLLQQACKILPISNLEFISMSADNKTDINWVEIFSCCSNVTTMQATGLGTSTFVRALTDPTVTNAGSSGQGRKRKHDNRESTLVQLAGTVAHAHSTALFPKLKFLELTNLDFFEGHFISGIPFDVFERLFDVFERGLQQRMAASGAPLWSLTIRECGISPEHASGLEELVQCFRWDGTKALIKSVAEFESIEAYEEYLLGAYDGYRAESADW